MLGCNRNKNPEGVKSKASPQSESNSATYDSYDDKEDSFSQDYPPIEHINFDVEAPDIKIKKNLDLSISDKSTHQELLKQLYPGLQLKFNYLRENVDMLLWRCTDCSSRTVQEVNTKNRIEFPGRHEWDTRAIGLHKWRSKEAEWLALFESHAIYEKEPSHTGRMNNPVVGVSIWKKKDKSWQLKHHHAGLYAMGSFGIANQPKIAGESSQELFFYASDPIGGAGGPYLSNLVLFHWNGNKVEQILALPNAESNYDGFLQWTTNLYIKPESQRMPLLLCVMEGNYSKIHLEDWLWETLPQDVREMAGERQEFKFKRNQEYIWNGKQYIANGEAMVSISHLIYPMKK